MDIWNNNEIMDAVESLRAQGIRAQLLVFRPDFDRPQEAVAFLLPEGRACVPANVWQEPPTELSKWAMVREHEVKPGQVEIAVIDDKFGRKPIAWPARLPSGESSTICDELPGVRKTYKATFIPNRGVQGVFCAYRHPDVDRNAEISIFLGENDKIEKFSPNSEETGKWREDPEDGEEVDCWISWCQNVRSEGIIYGWAFRALSEGEDKEEPVESEATGHIIVAQELPVTSLGDQRTIVIPEKCQQIKLIMPGKLVRAYVDLDTIRIELEN